MYATYPGDKKSRLRRLYINFVVKIRPPDSQGHPYAVKIPFRIRPPDSQVVLIPSKFLFAYARQTHRSCLSRQNSFSHTPPPDSQVVLIPSNFIFAYCTPARLTRSCLSRQNSFSSGRLRKIDNLLTVRFRMQNPWQNHLLRSDLSYLKKHPPPLKKHRFL